MPYIAPSRRVDLDSHIGKLLDLLEYMAAQEGDYNYLITRILAGGFNLDTDPRYAKINAIIGILECVKLEMYRRIAAEYENEKIAENGDVPEYSD